MPTVSLWLFVKQRVLLLSEICAELEQGVLANADFIQNCMTTSVSCSPWDSDSDGIG